MLIFRNNLTVKVIYVIIRMEIHRKEVKNYGAYKSWPSGAVRRGGVFLCTVAGAVAEGKNIA
jgi:hypothetical protein